MPTFRSCAHRRHATVGNPEMIFLWKCCDEDYLTLSAIVEHLEWNHSFFKRGVVPYVCSFCSAGFQNGEDSINHILNAHVRYFPKCRHCLRQSNFSGIQVDGHSIVADLNKVL